MWVFWDWSGERWLGLSSPFVFTILSQLQANVPLRHIETLLFNTENKYPITVVVGQKKVPPCLYAFYMDYVTYVSQKIVPWKELFIYESETSFQNLIWTNVSSLTQLHKPIVNTRTC